MTPVPGLEPGPKWWEVRHLTASELVFCFSAMSIRRAYPANYHFFYNECLEAWSDFSGHIVAIKQDVLNEMEQPLG